MPVLPEYFSPGKTGKHTIYVLCRNVNAIIEKSIRNFLIFFVYKEKHSLHECEENGGIQAEKLIAEFGGEREGRYAGEKESPHVFSAHRKMAPRRGQFVLKDALFPP